MHQKYMEAICIKPPKKIGFVSLSNNVVAEKKKHAELEEFLKGTISGEELVKYVCDSLDEKYSKNRFCSI